MTSSSRRPMVLGRLVLGLSMIGACRGEAAVTTTTTPIGEVSPEATAAAFITGMAAGDAEGVAAVTVLDQMPWIAMAEGASIEEAAGLGSSGLDRVAANYWKGFLQAAPLATAELGAVDIFQQGAHRFARIEIAGGDHLAVVLRFDDDWRVDVLASFGAGLAQRLLEAVELVRANEGFEAAQMRSIIALQTDSVEVVASNPELSGSARDVVALLVESVKDLGT